MVEEMKRILLFSHAMEIGGAERGLLGLLDAFDYSRVLVDLFLLKHSGELLPFVNPNVNLLPEKPPYASMMRSVWDVVRKGHFSIAAGRLYGKVRAKHYNKVHCVSSQNDTALQYMHKYSKRCLPEINDMEYDLAISFLTPHYIVAEKVKAKEKIAWIHTDYSVVDTDVNSALQMWGRYNHIMSISPKVTESFIQKMPSLKDKIVLFDNILPEKLIRNQADAFVPEDMTNDRNIIKILSLGRFCNAKNFDNVPEICVGLRKAGLQVKWYLIGYGGDEELIRRKIKEFNMQEYVIILGKKENPYPYIKACDVYIQPSRYEGKCVAVREAQMLGIPVIITNYTTSASQLEDGVDGVIVPQEMQACIKGIAAVLQNKKLLKTLSGNCQKRDYSNTSEIDKLYKII